MTPVSFMNLNNAEFNNCFKGLFWPEMETFREALMLLLEPRGVNQGKQGGFHANTLKKYTWGGLLSKNFNSRMGKLNC